jgi:DNA-binding MarR family transcriptional regulator
VPPIGARVLVVPVVDHDDVAVGRLPRQPRRKAIGAALAAPVEIPHAPGPSGQPIAGLRQPAVHPAAAPSRVRPEQAAGRAAGNRLDARGIAIEQRRQVGGGGDHQAASAAVQPNRVALIGDAFDDGDGLAGDVVVDQEERGARLRVGERIEQGRRPHRIRPIVERQVHVDAGDGVRIDAPERLTRFEGFEQEGKGRGVRQHEQAQANRKPGDHQHESTSNRAGPTAAPVDCQTGQRLTRHLLMGILLTMPTRRHPSRLQQDIKQSRPFATPAQEAAMSVLRAADRVRRHLGRVVGREGLTHQQYNVLRILRGAGGTPLSALEIGERLIEETPGVSRLIERLVAKGLVRRDRGRQDRRLLECAITEEGLELLARLDRPVEHANGELLEPLGAARTRTLIALLSDLREPRA